jgi:hypothetical protein
LITPELLQEPLRRHSIDGGEIRIENDALASKLED